MVTFVLVGVGFGEGGDRVVEVGGAAEVGDPVAGAGMCPGEGPSAHAGVGSHAGRDHLLDRGGQFPVLQLADVEVAAYPIRGGHVGPAEEDVAFGLHQVLPCDDPLAPVAVLAAPAMCGKHGHLGLLGLQEQRFGPVSALHQGDPRAGADVRVPHVHEVLMGKRAHRCPVALGRREHDLATFLSGEPVVPAGHGQAGRQPLDVPLERAGQGLVEVVDIEDQPPRGRGERPEIGQVRVTAQLHPQP